MGTCAVSRWSAFGRVAKSNCRRHGAEMLTLASNRGWKGSTSVRFRAPCRRAGGLRRYCGGLNAASIHLVYLAP